MTAQHLKTHLAELTANADDVRDYGGHSATGFSSQGAMSPGGASGADYETSSADSAGDADSAGPTGN
jgi:hypothetical protein